MRIPGFRPSRLSPGVLPAALFLLVIVAPPARAQVCGDVNDSGSVTTGDALSVLRYAVGQEVDLICGGECATLEPRVDELEDALATTQQQLAQVTTALTSLQALLAGVSRTEDALVISGVNLQVVDGSGATAGPVNGVGNIIIGYNEQTGEQTRTGSHNLIIGVEHEYTSFAGIVAGERNTISNRAATVLGGMDNAATFPYSSVAGGSENSAIGQFASVAGGFLNKASGTNAAVAGGCENEATNTYAAVSGGRLSIASGQWSSVTGGYNNKATALYSAVSGGSTRTASTQYNWKAGALSEAQ